MKKRYLQFLCFILALIFTIPVLTGCANGDDNKSKAYTITVTSNSFEQGSVLGTGSYAKDEKIYIFAQPKAGYEFDKWNDDNKENPRQVNVDEDKIFIAYFTASTTTKQAIVESVQMETDNGWGSKNITSVDCINWSVIINNFEYGGNGYSERLLTISDDVSQTSRKLNGCRKSHGSLSIDNATIFAKNLVEVDKDIQEKITLTVDLLVTKKDNDLDEINQKLNLVSNSVKFVENSDTIEVLFECPNYGNLKVTIIYSII